jgi:hypothetical protein
MRGVSQFHETGEIYDPSPREIAAATALIRKRWSEAEARRRVFGADKDQQDPWAVPVIDTAGLEDLIFD